MGAGQIFNFGEILRLPPVPKGGLSSRIA